MTSPLMYIVQQKVATLGELANLKREHPADAKRLREMAIEEMVALSIPVKDEK